MSNFLSNGRPLTAACENYSPTQHSVQGIKTFKLSEYGFVDTTDPEFIQLQPHCGGLWGNCKYPSNDIQYTNSTLGEVPFTKRGSTIIQGISNTHKNDKCYDATYFLSNDYAYNGHRCLLFCKAQSSDEINVYSAEYHTRLPGSAGATPIATLDAAHVVVVHLQGCGGNGGYGTNAFADSPVDFGGEGGGGGGSGAYAICLVNLKNLYELEYTDYSRKYLAVWYDVQTGHAHAEVYSYSYDHSTYSYMGGITCTGGGNGTDSDSTNGGSGGAGGTVGCASNSVVINNIMYSVFSKPGIAGGKGQDKVDGDTTGCVPQRVEQQQIDWGFTKTYSMPDTWNSGGGIADEGVAGGGGGAPSLFGNGGYPCNGPWVYDSTNKTSWEHPWGAGGGGGCGGGIDQGGNVHPGKGYPGFAAVYLQDPNNGYKF